MNGRRGALFGSDRGGDTADLREYNLGIVLRFLSTHGPASRAAIADASGLGLSTLTGMIAELKGLELISEELAGTQARVGRPTHDVTLTGDRWVVAGVRLDADGVKARTATVGGVGLAQYADRIDLGHSDKGEAASALAVAIEWILDSVSAPRSLVSVVIACDLDGLDPVAAVSEQLRLVDRSEVLVSTGSVGALAALASVDLVRAESSTNASPAPIIVYLGGERAVGGAILLGTEPISSSPGNADFGRMPVAGSEGGRATLGRAASLSALVAAAGIRSENEVEALVAVHPHVAVAALADALRAEDPRASGAVAIAAAALSYAIDSVVAMLGPVTVVLDGYLGELGAWLVPAMDARADIVASDLKATRAVDGAVEAAVQACLAQPAGLRAHQIRLESM
ncbi:hypothetical protein [Agreia sp. COWG]|uniref:hypothetical protein n=1 Tax=Agreia sp. COWG TaxID=2773266 RepID=UPI001928CD53|nr:hypothetical protein [Agreia sp. COWG]CAD6007199.1 Sugar kinase of the NBD/HSP70 family, may contain an N-terminal HTH domain [Agreia sp. COWG]